MKLSKYDIFLNVMLFSLLFLVGCVGTVEEGGTRSTDFSVGNQEKINYTGIVRATAIAEKKIEIEFEEIFNPETHNYFLHINENEPYKLSLESLGQGQIGYKKYTLKNLLPNSFYKLRVSVADLAGRKSSGENEVIVKTFDNKVSDFGGIVNVQPLTGKSHNSVRVSWIPTNMQGTYESGPFDTVYYEITYMKTSTPLQEINTPGAADRSVIKLTASASNNPGHIDIKVLEPETSYYFQVRAVHKLYSDQEDDKEDFGTPITLNKDLNSNWISYTTSANTGFYDFQKDSVVLQNGAGLSGLSTIKVFWTPPEGIFESYKVFYREYTAADGTSPLIDDELTPLVMQGYLDASDTTKYVSVDVDKTFVNISGLNKYSWYQVKVVPCKTVSCVIEPLSDPDSSQVSDLRSIRVEPQLAPFFGINFINEPSDANAVDEITLEFDSPVLSQGYANKLEVYCLSFDQSSYVKLSNTPVTSAVGNCNGLSFKESINVNSTTKITIDSVNNIKSSPTADASYCFAVAPAIEGAGLETKKLHRDDWTVRCIQPDIKTPTLQEFTGFSGQCNVVNDTISLSWNAPSGGIYNSYRIFAYKTVSASETFNYFEMINKQAASDPNLVVIDKGMGDTSELLTNLEPGAKYQLGILATIDGGTPGDYSDDIYSEYNMKSLECTIPYPKATFKEWSRLFAIGPKENGKVPRTNGSTTISQNALIVEALNSEGLPYEVERTGDYVTGFNIVSPGNFQLSPGNFESVPATSFAGSFDGKHDNGAAASKTGVISLAWKNVTLDFSQAVFNAAQDHGSRVSRDFGYRVYRSDDNRENWIEVTDNSGLIHSGDYNYYLRSNSVVQTEKMSFFTDYSVASLDSGNTYVDRARVYWYKVVPVYNGVELKYLDQASITPHAQVKVTLPPANMALVHRKMANRNICLEIDKDIDKSNNYRCDYNGIGSRPKSYPWRLGETVYDFGSDMLIDRNELGCNFTRGSSTASPQYSNSYYDRGDYNQTAGLRSELAFFRGYSTNASDQDDLPFRGCTQSVSYEPYFTSLQSMIDTDQGQAFDPSLLGADYDEKQFDDLMYGDCIYSNVLTLYGAKCTNLLTAVRPARNYPGLPSQNAYAAAGPGEANCTVIDNDRPQFFYGDNSTEVGLLDESFIQNVTMQAEHMAVIYNRNNTASHFVNPYGPTGGMLDFPANNYTSQQSCFINLAAIGAKPATGNAEWKSRWIPASLVSHLKQDDTDKNILNKTVADLHADSQLYSTGDPTEYRVPDASLNNSERFNDTTKIARIISSNSAKLPPLIGFSRLEANRVCESYEVEVGFSGDSGYTQLSLPKSKRLLRKNEFTVAAAHSEQKVDNIVGDLVSDTIYNIERGHENGSCVSSGNIDGRSQLNFNSRKYSSDKGLTNLTSSFLWTGSSSQDRPGAQNSEKCMSRYGIQDLVGNVSEIGPEQLSCDYSLDRIFYGVENVASQSILIDGFKDPLNKTGYTRLYNRGESHYIDRNAKIRLVGPNGVDDSASGGGDDIILGDTETLVIWTDSSPLSGYCALADNDDSRVLSDLNFMQTNGDFKSTLKFNNTLDTNLVRVENVVDQLSIDWLRNGDGRFINSGPVNILPKLADFTDTWALSGRGVAAFDANNQAIANYFNPVVGLPLICDNTDRESCGADSSDNTTITTEYLKNPGVFSYTIDDFPIGHSQILHKSLGTTTSIYRDLDSTQAQTDGTNLVIKEIVVDSADLVDIETKDVVNVKKEVPATSGTAVDMDRTEFDIERFSYLSFVNGGDFSSLTTGRYGLSIGVESPDAESIWNKRNPNTGFRCGVRINE